MKLLGELNDSVVLGCGGLSRKPPRLTARAIVKTQDGYYAVMYAHKFNLYSLPGGGIEAGGTHKRRLYAKSTKKQAAPAIRLKNWASSLKTVQASIIHRSTIIISLPLEKTRR